MDKPVNRRQFLKGALAVTAAAAVSGRAQVASAAEAASKPADKPNLQAAPCGLYCGICAGFVSGLCHGCGCDCGKCDGQAHRKGCGIANCAAGRKLPDCSGCDDLACTRLVQFCNDPIWRTHAPVIDNLRRRRKVGVEAWLKEQQAHWQDKGERECWLALYAQCDKRCAEYRKAKKLD
jgi:hypothetical protein